MGTAELTSAMGTTEWKKSFLRASLAFHINLAPFTPKLCMVVYTFSPKKTEKHVKQKHTQRFKIGHQLSTAQRETTGVLPT